MGKTTLVAAALERMPEFRPVVIRADESESLVEYCVLSQLTATLPSRHVESLPLLSAGPPRGVPAVSVGAELVRVLGDLDLGGPLVFVVEDAHWLDRATAQALQFAVRRLGVEHALVVVTTRGGRRPVDVGWTRLAESPGLGHAVRLGPLTVPEVGELAELVRGRTLPPAAVARLRDETGGHPLHVRLVVEQSSWQELVSTTVRLAAPASLTDTVLTRLATLSGPAQDVVVAVAVLGGSASVAVTAAVSAVGALAAAVEEAVASGLLVERAVAGGRRLAFDHPLLAAAVVEGVGETRRRRFHLAASQVLRGDAALGHRLAVAAGPDDVLAADLEAAAYRLEAAGEVGMAAARMLAAAEASPGSEAAEQRLLLGVGLLLTAGDMMRATELAPQVRLCRASPRREVVLAFLAVHAGRFQEAGQLLRTAPHDARARGDARVEAAAHLTRLIVATAVGASGIEDADQVLANPAALPEWRRQALMLGPFSLGLAGRARDGLARLDATRVSATSLDQDQLPLVAARGALRLWNGEEEGALVDLRAVELAIRHGRFLAGFIPSALALLAEAELSCGSWDAAAADAGLALSVAEGEGASLALCRVHAVNARVHAERGDWSAAQSAVNASLRWDTAIPSAANRFYAATAGAYLARARGDPRAMLAALDAAVTGEITFRAGELRILRAEALMGLGRLDEADRLTATLTSADGSIGWQARLIQAGVALARSDLPRARREIGTLLDAIPLSHPFLRARVQLARADLLSAGGDGGGQAALRSAQAIFAGLGARPWEERCQQLLARRGERAARAMPVVRLTERERQVAHLVAHGMMNAEVAARLYVSEKTVEFHLTNIYLKFGISSRRALTRRLAAAPSPLGVRQT